MSRTFNAFDFNARIRSNNDAEKYFLYDVAFRGRLAGDNLDLGPLSLAGPGKTWTRVSADRLASRCSPWTVWPVWCLTETAASSWDSRESPLPTAVSTTEA